MRNAKQKTRHPGRVFLSKSKNRPYLSACPADIVNAEFYLDLKLQKKVMKLSIRNKSERALTALTILARYLDKNGVVMGNESGFIILRFENIFCAPARTSLTSKTVVLPYQDIAGIEAYITSVTYENGETQSFSQEDYTLTPVQDMLENRMSEEDFALLRSKFGRRCVFVPSALPSGEWLCSCGAVCTESVCSVCAMKKKDASHLIFQKSTDALLRSLRSRRRLLRAIPYAAALLVAAGGVFLAYNRITHYARVTLPESRLAVTRQYMEEHRYTEALGYSVSKNNSLLYDEILDHAVSYYCAEGDYDEALLYEQCRVEPDYETVYQSAALAYLDGSMQNCEKYALSVSDENLYNRVLEKMSRAKLDALDYDGAAAYALAMKGEVGTAFADFVLYKGISAALENSQYEKAVSYIAHLRDTSRVAELCRGIEKELLNMGKYDDAFTVASITGDSGVFETAYPDASTTTVRRYYDKFSPYMSESEKRAFLSTPMDVGGSLAAIDAKDTAIDSTLGVLCTDAVSVSVGEAHVLVLQKDGTVRAFGDNSFSQCGCDGIGGAIAVSAGKYHSLVLLSDGTVRAFGQNTHQQCVTDSWKNVIAIAAGDYHSAAVTADGKAIACGSDVSGQCDVTAYTDVIGVAAGEYATALLLRNGSICTQGNISLETFEARQWEDIIRVAMGNSHLIALSSGGRVLFAGDPGYIGADQVDDWSRIRFIACGERASYAIDANGNILSCGTEIPELNGEEWESLLP